MDLSKYRFSQTHEWVTENGEGALIGISDYAQSQLGDVIYVELPRPGTEVSQGSKFGVIESVKAASDLYSPVNGRVVEANPLLTDRPELINSDPQGDGWMLRLELSGPVSTELLDEAAYTTFTEGL
jgi:glycine cleavage system H protein